MFNFPSYHYEILAPFYTKSSNGGNSIFCCGYFPFFQTFINCIYTSIRMSEQKLLTYRTFDNISDHFRFAMTCWCNYGCTGHLHNFI